MQDSNQPTQLQRLARIQKFCVEQVYQLYFNTWERTTKPLIRLCRCVGWSAPLMFACSYRRFSLDTLHKLRPFDFEINQAVVIIIFQCFHTLARSVFWWQVQRALLINASDWIKSEVKCKMSQNKKKVTRRAAYSAQKVVRHSPPCWTGDDGLVDRTKHYSRKLLFNFFFNETQTCTKPE